jgi:hypothetical protein
MNFHPSRPCKLISKHHANRLLFLANNMRSMDVEKLTIPE